MPTPRLSVLVVGATGSIGRLVVEESVRAGHLTRALVRRGSGTDLAAGATCAEGDLTDATTLTDAVDGVDAVVFAHGSHGGAEAAEAVDYGAVANTLTALAGREVRIAVMTTIGVTQRSTGHDWKRRGERLVRASGNPYTVVRPGWFDHQQADQNRLHLLQGDTRRAGDPSDGVVARRQIAEVLIGALTDDAAAGKTFELVAEQGPAQADLHPLFAGLRPDRPDALDGVEDQDNQPLDDEPERVRAALRAGRDRLAAVPLAVCSPVPTPSGACWPGVPAASRADSRPAEPRPERRRRGSGGTDRRSRGRPPDRPSPPGRRSAPLPRRRAAGSAARPTWVRSRRSRRTGVARCADRRRQVRRAARPG